MRKQVLSCTVLWLLLWWPTAGRGYDPGPSPLPEPSSQDVEYEGTLSCSRCDPFPTAENRALCQHEGHLPLLRREEGGVHILIGGTNAITARLASDELHGKKVHLEGIYYPKANYILVSKVNLESR